MLFIASYIKCWASIMWFLKHDSLLHYIAFNSHLCESSISHTESYRWWCPLEINSIHKSKHSTVVTINLSFGLFIGFTKDSFFVFDKIWANCNYWSLVLCLYIFWRCKKEHYVTRSVKTGHNYLFSNSCLSNIYNLHSWMYLLVKFQLHIPMPWGVTALQSSNNKINLYSEYRGINYRCLWKWL